ncbi:MAG: alpha/beta fold hydrolase [Bacteroidales bacterium]|nr:alpha/beta fold hydrolase [Bacteroidales bacterium]
MELFFRKYGDPGSYPLIILHGLFGLSDNWVTYARRIAMEGFEVYVIDQRNHGQSPHSPVFNYLTLTSDLTDFIEDHEIKNPILLGHSMGGKVAMRYTLENPDLVKRLIVVDIGIKAYPPRQQHIEIIKAMRQINLANAKSRHDVEHQLEPLIPQIRIRQFVLKNIYRDENNNFRWRLNVEGIEPNLNDMMDSIDFDQTYDRPTLFIRGGASDYILPLDYGDLRKNFPHAEIITIEGASHWVHVEAWERFYQITFGFMTGKPSWYQGA